MASVCGSSLSLMDAGVPIKRPVAGIAMGLIKEGDDYVVLSDIAGVEDHLGDMDFKVAGTERGITALQMDIKITGVTFDILRDALSQAKEGDLHPRQDGRGHRGRARRAVAVRAAHLADQDRPGQDRPADRQGRRDDPRPVRRVRRADRRRRRRQRPRLRADRRQQGDALIDRIRSMTKEVEVGDSFQGKVVKTTTFGAFVELAKGTDGLLHISNVSPGQRVDTVEDVLNKGDEIAVRVVEVDRERGRIGLRLAEDPEIGKSVEELAGVGGGGGGGDRGGPRGRDRNGRGGGDRGGRGRDRDRGPRPPRGDRDRTTALARRVADHQITELDSGCRIATEHMSSVRSAALGFVATGSRASRRPARPGSRTSSSTCCSAAPTASLGRDRPAVRVGAELNAGTDKETTTVYARMLDRHLAEAFDGLWRDMVRRPAFRHRPRARGRARGDRDVRRRPQDTVFDVLGEAVFGGHPARAAIIGGRRRSRHPGATPSRPSTRAATSRARW